MERESVKLLDELSALGMTDEHFRIIHHEGASASISRHRNYCLSIDDFQRNGTNDCVKQRLIWIRRAISKGDYGGPVSNDEFRSLAEDARFEIPR
jgi:hypothetical protein